MHTNYGSLLEFELNNNKAEYHYKKAIEYDTTDEINYYNYALFLKNQRFKYEQSLIYCDKACELKPYNSDFHSLTGQAKQALACDEEFSIRFDLV